MISIDFNWLILFLNPMSNQLKKISNIANSTISEVETGIYYGIFDQIPCWCLGPWFNIKMWSCQYEEIFVKIRRSQDRLSSINPSQVRCQFYIELAPGSSHLHVISSYATDSRMWSCGNDCLHLECISSTCDTTALNRPIAQIPQCTNPISHIAPLCTRNVQMYAHFT